MIIKEGFYTGLSNEDYHANKESISRSSIMDFKKSPRNYWAKHLNPNRPAKEIKASWEFGTAFHTLILEPEIFEKTYYVLPEKVLLKEVGKKAFKEYKKAEKEVHDTNKKLLSCSDGKRLSAMQYALYKNERALQLITDGIYESSFFWKDDPTDLMIKARPDILNHNAYIDLKTIDDAAADNFQKEMVKYGYHIQAAMVKDGVKQVTGEVIKACINICVEKTYPYSVAIYIIDEEAIDIGKMIYKSLLLDLQACIITNDFMDYPIQTIGLPRWALK